MSAAVNQKLHLASREESHTGRERSVEPSMEEILASIRRIIIDDQLHSPSMQTDSFDSEYGEGITFDDESIKQEFRPSTLSALDVLTSIEKEENYPEAVSSKNQVFEEKEKITNKQEGEPLLSSTANATTASAFESLSSIVMSRQSRTIDDLVQDMLRPMLKEWLDENLPSLVERLVRAEIERITCGLKR